MGKDSFLIAKDDKRKAYRVANLHKSVMSKADFTKVGNPYSMIAKADKWEDS
jgi:hypothetical protein